MHETFIQTLESRKLMSVSPLSTAVQLDRLHVKLDLLRFRIDIAVGSAKLLADRRALIHSVPKGDTSLVAPLAQLAADNKTMQTALRADRLAESAAALTEQAVIKLDQLQILKDKGDSTAEAADHTKLMNDRVVLQNAYLSGLDARIATRMADESTISTDAQAIVTAADSDPAATATMLAAAGKFSAKRVAVVTKLTSDLAVIIAARTQLAADLTVEAANS